jgi:hypothetical protein
MQFAAFILEITLRFASKTGGRTHQKTERQRTDSKKNNKQINLIPSSSVRAHADQEDGCREKINRNQNLRHK